MLVLRGKGSVLEGGTGFYFVVLGQYKAVPVGTWLYLVSRGRHWVLGQYGVVVGENMVYRVSQKKVSL